MDEIFVNTANIVSVSVVNHDGGRKHIAIQMINHNYYRTKIMDASDPAFGSLQNFIDTLINGSGFVKLPPYYESTELNIERNTEYIESAEEHYGSEHQSWYR